MLSIILFCKTNNTTANYQTAKMFFHMKMLFMLTLWDALYDEEVSVTIMMGLIQIIDLFSYKPSKEIHRIIV